jgi:hypothetical protein
MKQHLEKNLLGMEFTEDEIEAIRNFLPKNKFISAEGTSEGITSSAYSQSLAHFGSVNILSSEWGDALKSSEGLTLKLKEMFDGELLAKNIKTENNKNIENITANAMLFGSSVGFDKESKTILLRALKSGMYRRSFIVNVDQSFNIEEQCNESDLNISREYISNLIKQ